MEIHQDVDLELQQIMLQSKLKFFVRYYLYIILLAYERLVCKTPIAYFPSIPGTFPEDVPFGIAFANEENDPWTESSHKFRFYQQPILSRCDPCEINVGTIIEVYVTAEENS